MRFAVRTHMPNAAEARAQVAPVGNLPPSLSSMEDVARRVADAQAAEQDLVSRIMQARALEDEAARDVQRKAEDHAKAQLELRRLDVLSTRYSVSRAQHDQARNEEYGARQRLEKARATREEYSHARAATEKELYRIKTELTELKNTSRHAGSVPDHVQRIAPASPQISSTPDAPDIVAPLDAVVMDIFVQPGIWAQPHQALIALMPVAASLEATAWFPEKEGVNIQSGQYCRIFILELPGKSFPGKVVQVLPAGSLTPKFTHAAPVSASQIPVRIRFSAEDAKSYAELKSGMRAAVRVHKFTPPWMHIDALAVKIGGKK